MTTAREGDEGSASRLGRFLSPGKIRYPLYRRLGGPRAGLARWGNSPPPPPGFNPWTVQPLGSRYTDYDKHNYAAVAVLFLTYSNTCSNSYVVRLLTMIFDSAVLSTYSELHIVLNGGTAKIAVIISVPMSLFTTLKSTITKCLLQSWCWNSQDLFKML
jgi:hypothetical protein